MERHEWLSQELAGLHYYASILHEGASDAKVAPAGRYACFAAAKYLVEVEDVIPDTDAFGLVDDLFVIFYGLGELNRQGGRHAQSTYGTKPACGGGTVTQKLQEAKTHFSAFWSYMEDQVARGFQEIARAISKEPAHGTELLQTLAHFVHYVSQRPIQVAFTKEQVDGFVRQRQAKKTRTLPS
jgi:uncharacterized membrane protein YkvA (DUF1232 family)